MLQREWDDGGVAGRVDDVLDPLQVDAVVQDDLGQAPDVRDAVVGDDQHVHLKKARIPITLPHIKMVAALNWVTLTKFAFSVGYVPAGEKVLAPNSDVAPNFPLKSVPRACIKNYNGSP